MLSLYVRAETMLRAENRRQRDVFRCRHFIDEVGEVAIDRGVVTDDADSGVFQPA
jgi:hypothetical protein